mmetsp:Transcript_22319/g.15912  ORF Transcript_22319/g.15912 Transcript_22319/m.15912 type:complete len:203 (-) Transcript_22319:680-1288(-)
MSKSLKILLPVTLSQIFLLANLSSSRASLSSCSLTWSKELTHFSAIHDSIASNARRNFLYITLNFLLSYLSTEIAEKLLISNLLLASRDFSFSYWYKIPCFIAKKGLDLSMVRLEVPNLAMSPTPLIRPPNAPPPSPLSLVFSITSDPHIFSSGVTSCFSSSESSISSLSCSLSSLFFFCSSSNPPSLRNAFMSKLASPVTS